MSTPAGTPVPPIRRVFFRYVARLGKFVPCAEREGTLVAPVDGQGRTVMAVTGTDAVFKGVGREGPTGWTFTHESSLIDPADVRAYLTTSTRRKR